MYRVANQFDPSNRQDDLSAAGGGSTSTTCSSCVATLAGASIVTAVIFSRIAPGNDAETAGAPHAADAASTAEDAAPVAYVGNAGAAANPGSNEPVYTVDIAGAAESNDPQALRADPESPAHIAEPGDEAAPLSFAARTILGLGSFILSIGVGLLGAQFVQPVFGFILFCGTYIGLFCWVYERSRRSAGRGALIAILVLAASLALSAVEMYMWLRFM